MISPTVGATTCKNKLLQYVSQNNWTLLIQTDNWSVLPKGIDGEHQKELLCGLDPKDAAGVRLFALAEQQQVTSRATSWGRPLEKKKISYSGYRSRKKETPNINYNSMYFICLCYLYNTYRPIQQPLTQLGLIFGKDADISKLWDVWSRIFEAPKTNCAKKK